jgi:Ca-activated chloride channel family protein
MSQRNDFADDRFQDDVRLTAYALGELSGDDLREIEALVASNADARNVVEEIRATASLVAAELRASDVATLTPEQRARIASRTDGAKPVVPMRRVWWTAAAALVVGATAGALTSRRWSTTPERQIARDDANIKAGADRFVDAERSRAEAESLLKELQNSNTAVANANAQLRADLDKLSEAQKESQRRFRESGGGGGHAEDSVLGSGMTGGGGGGGGGTANYPVEPKKPSIPMKKVGDKTKDGSTLLRSAKGFNPGLDTPTVAPHGADAAAPPDAVGPATPGAADAVFTASGSLEALGRLEKFADYHKLTPAQKQAFDELFNDESKVLTAAEVNQRVALLRSANGVDFSDLFSESNTASYSHIEDNPFRLVKDDPLSTFGADVDTASYSNVRRFLNSGQLPPPGAVRIEEMVNYFPYDYAPPTDGRPFAVRVDVAGCPWKTDHRLVRIGIKGKIVETAARPAANLVFLLDVSGSMSPAERLPLVVESMKKLVGELATKDRVAIVVYAGASGLVLDSTSCEDKATILAALDRLQAGGSTNGAAGIQLAYEVATKHKIEGGVNRVILATDGDFNVGTSDESSLVKLIEDERKSGVFLSVLGVGTDNLNDSMMEKLADHGNGTYAYLDTAAEGEKVLVKETNGTLCTIAKDMKLQVEFNPAQVGAWRLIGYEDRVLAAADFKDDKKDAGDVGAGHTVTALYELVPPGALTETAGVEPLKYQRAPAPSGPLSEELLTVKLRWKEPNADVSTPMEVAVIDEGLSYSAASPDFKFAASVAAFGMCLRGSPNKGQANVSAVLELATEGAANDPGGYRKEFVELVKRAKQLGAK